MGSSVTDTDLVWNLTWKNVSTLRYTAPSISTPAWVMWWTNAPVNIVVGKGVGHPLKQVTEATYLGAQLTPDGSPDHFVLSRLRKANAATKALASFFSASFLSPAFRLRVYQSIVQSILLYSIESVVPTPAHHQRMDALHFRVLRQIFKIRSSFFS